MAGSRQLASLPDVRAFSATGAARGNLALASLSATALASRMVAMCGSTPGVAQITATSCHVCARPRRIADELGNSRRRALPNRLRGRANFYRLMTQMRTRWPEQKLLVFLAFDLLQQDGVD